MSRRRLALAVAACLAAPLPWGCALTSDCNGFDIDGPLAEEQDLDTCSASVSGFYMSTIELLYFNAPLPLDRFYLELQRPVATGESGSATVSIVDPEDEWGLALLPVGYADYVVTEASPEGVEIEVTLGLCDIPGYGEHTITGSVFAERI